MFPADHTICSICSIRQFQSDTQELALANHSKTKPFIFSFSIYRRGIKCPFNSFSLLVCPAKPHLRSFFLPSTNHTGHQQQFAYFCHHQHHHLWSRVVRGDSERNCSITTSSCWVFWSFSTDDGKTDWGPTNNSDVNNDNAMVSESLIFNEFLPLDFPREAQHHHLRSPCVRMMIEEHWTGNKVPLKFSFIRSLHWISDSQTKLLLIVI